MYKNVIEIKHPLLQHKLTMLRDKNTSSKDFRDLVNEVSMLMAYEVTRNLPVKDIEIETPICKTTGKSLSGLDVAIVPIMRAGMGMVGGMLNLIPNAKVGHIGIYRNEETIEPVEYYCKLPSDISDRLVIVTDPMLATGGSLRDAVTMLKKRGAVNIKAMTLVSTDVGIKEVQSHHPDIEIYTISIDAGLNEKSYIVPGLGDAGDRLFGTK
ncbi:MAG: uracil phosphoribosyltransferase [Tissierellales bacterium]|jgi:uracil phosphoribosyltransferase|nr:uracil phosphoribosyltransferase [Tissierellales bacterium]MBN2826550.1 uracil phosphoribosyltransferase [Tissierellales bacterium]